MLSDRAKRWLTLAFCFAVSLAMVHQSDAQAIPVELKQTEQGWQLFRGGEPYRVKGAGGHQYLEQLSEAGGNTIRTWGVGPETKDLLDQAHSHGLAVIVGLWLGHERHGFDYTDLDAVAEQLEMVRFAVETYKDHPAVLAWGVGNEMEGFAEGDNAAIWSHVESCAAMIQRLDPNHPTLTVIAEIGGRKLEAIQALCPSIDIVGINSYGGGASIPQRYAKAGVTKPYIVTEFGPPGTWEVGKNSFGAPQELTSNEKALIYKKVYESLEDDAENCLGSFAFLWGAKVEATTTWFGMFLQDGSKLAAVDAMTEAWSGQKPDNLCPVIERFEIDGEYQKKPGAEVTVRLTAVDPEQSEVDVQWTIMADPSVYETGGDKTDAPPTFPDRIISSSNRQCTFTLPDKPGIYRIYAVVKDSSGHAAVANLPLYAGANNAAVNGESDITAGKPLGLPAAVYCEADGKTPWIASGYMGNAAAVAMEPGDTSDPKVGETALRVTYKDAGDWAGVVWQDPANDWGDVAGGYDLSGSTALEFYARGAKGGEVVNFGFGLLGADKKHRDSGSGELKEVRLTDQWQKYRIEIDQSVDMKRIKTGFYWTLAGQGDEVTFYLDEIRYVDGDENH